MMKESKGYLQKHLLITLFALAPLTALAQTTQPTDPESDHVITLENFSHHVEKGLKAKILLPNIYAHSPILANFEKEPLSYEQFLEQLDANGFTAIKTKHYIQIIANRDARDHNIPVVEKHKSYADAEYVTEVIHMEKLCADRSLAAIRPLVPQFGHLTAYEDVNSLIIIDTYGNIQRIKEVIRNLEKEIDKPLECTKPSAAVKK